MNAMFFVRASLVAVVDRVQGTGVGGIVPVPQRQVRTACVGRQVGWQFCLNAISKNTSTRQQEKRRPTPIRDRGKWR